MCTQSSHALARVFGATQEKLVSKIHQTEIVEAVKSPAKIDEVKNAKSIYKEPNKILGKDFYTAYYGINFVQNKN